MDDPAGGFLGRLVFRNRGAVRLVQECAESGVFRILTAPQIRDVELGVVFIQRRLGKLVGIAHRDGDLRRDMLLHAPLAQRLGVAGKIVGLVDEVGCVLNLAVIAVELFEEILRIAAGSGARIVLLDLVGRLVRIALEIGNPRGDISRLRRTAFGGEDRIGHERQNRGHRCRATGPFQHPVTHSRLCSICSRSHPVSPSRRCVSKG